MSGALSPQGVLTLDHVQLAIPKDGESAARAFYRDLLGFTEISKPAALEKRGGAWFAGGDARLHLGIDHEFRPARKAHPAFAVRGLAALIARIEAAGISVTWDDAIAGVDRVFVFDPFGNRIELIESRAAPDA
jgi:catechol 2,3-dioxygenase-like lactoylglutathione lyase family enzyme